MLKVLAGLLPLLSLASLSLAHGDHGEKPASSEPWLEKYGGTPDLVFSGINGFARIPHAKCLEQAGKGFDIAILGVPLDTTVSYRPGARFGPQAIRAGSRRHGPARAFLIPWGENFIFDGLDVIDCNDVPLSQYDPALAIDEIQTAYSTLINRPTIKANAETNSYTAALAKDGKEHPRILTFGGDHTVVLPILGALNDVYGPISVIHFDAHLDTWSGATMLAGAYTKQSQVTHGTFFWKAHELGFVSNTSSVHAGIRTRLGGMEDLLHDEAVGFQVFTTDDIDDMGAEGIAAAIKKRVGNGVAYLSFDIDTIDPSMAPATGTPESGGWTTREVKKIIRALAGKINIVGADIVEVAPAYDTNAEVTAMAAADLAQEFIGLMTARAPPRPAVKGGKLDAKLRAEVLGKKAEGEVKDKLHKVGEKVEESVEALVAELQNLVSIPKIVPDGNSGQKIFETPDFHAALDKLHAKVDELRAKVKPTASDHDEL